MVCTKVSFHLLLVLVNVASGSQVSSGKWYDAPDDFAMAAPLCEAMASSCQSAGNQYQYHFKGEKCYFKLSGDGLRRDASSQCSQAVSAAHLVYITDAEENAAARKACGSNMCWIGLSERPGSETWIWDDGNALAFSSWADGEPNNWGGRDETVAMMNLDIQKVFGAGEDPLSSGKWHDAPSTWSFSVPVCEVAATSCNSSGMSPPGLASTYSFSGQKCYFKLSGEGDRNVAFSRCSQAMSGAHLPYIENAKENDAVREACGKAMCWIGLAKRNELWFWDDGIASRYTNWDVGQPGNDAGDETLAFMNVDMAKIGLLVAATAMSSSIAIGSVSAIAICCTCLVIGGLVVACLCGGFGRRRKRGLQDKDLEEDDGEE